MEEKEGWGEEKEEERRKGERKNERKKERRKGGKKTVREKEGWKKKVGKKEEKGEEKSRKERRKEGSNAERMAAASKECTKWELLAERSVRYKANHTFQEFFRLPIGRMEVNHNSINKSINQDKNFLPAAL